MLNKADVLMKLYEAIPLDIAVIDLVNMDELESGDILINVAYPMLDDDLNETLCFSKNMSSEDVLIHLEELVKEKYAEQMNDPYIQDKMNEFLNIIEQQLQTL